MCRIHRSEIVAVEQSSKVTAYGTPKGDEVIMVGLLEVLNDNLIINTSAASSTAY